LETNNYPHRKKKDFKVLKLCRYQQFEPCGLSVDPEAKSGVLKVNLGVYSLNLIIGQTKELFEKYSSALPYSEFAEIPRSIGAPMTKKMKLSVRFLSRQLGNSINYYGIMRINSQEFMMYLAEPRLPADSDVDMPSFLKSKRATYRKLVPLAKILAVPATRVRT
jgi:hypothetical protein